MTDLMPIGRFAEITRISIRMLRYYDERGLLTPARVDAASGYRYYGAEQALQAEVIRLLRAIDMPLDEIGRLLSEPGAEGIAARLAEHREKVEARLDEIRRTLAYLDELIAHVERGGELPAAPAVLRDEPDLTILSRRARRTLDDVGVYIGGTIGEMFRLAGEINATPDGAPMAIYQLPPGDDDSFDVEVCLPVARAGNVTAPFTSGRLPGGPAAVILHTGPYEAIGAAYRALGDWMLRHGHEPAGPPREVYLTAPGADRDPAGFRTELVWPVRPSSP